MKFEVLRTIDNRYSVQTGGREIALLPPMGSEEMVNFRWAHEVIGPETARAIEKLLNSLYETAADQ
jgi:hypothetical protein